MQRSIVWSSILTTVKPKLPSYTRHTTRATIQRRNSKHKKRKRNSIELHKPSFVGQTSAPSGKHIIGGLYTIVTRFGNVPSLRTHPGQPSSEQKHITIAKAQSLIRFPPIFSHPSVQKNSCHVQ